MRRIVPEELDLNPWIFYHTTSSVRSKSIEKDGFKATEETAFPGAALKMLTIFKSLGWDGDHRGGCCVLESFSFRRNNIREQRPVYFTAYGHRSLIYGRPDFAGGETARALRFGYRDLERYLNDDAFREAAIERKRKECLELIAMDGRPFFPVIRPDLNWLRSRLKELSGLYHKLELLETAHIHGVLYAVELRPEDLTHMTYNWSDGAAVYAPIQAGRIRLKVDIVDSNEIGIAYDDPEKVSHWQAANNWREESPLGPIVRLAQRENNARQASETHDVDLELARLVDPNAGVDERFSLAIEKGRPLLAQWARDQLSQRNSRPE